MKIHTYLSDLEDLFEEYKEMTTAYLGYEETVESLQESIAQCLMKISDLIRKK